MCSYFSHIWHWLTVARRLKAYVRIVSWTATFVLLIACSSAAGGSTPANERQQLQAASVADQGVFVGWEKQWESIIAAAKQESEVVIYGPPGAAYRRAFVDAFEKDYPGIKVSFVGLTGADIAPRILAERQAGKFAADLHIGGTTTITNVLKPVGALDPITPLLILPEVKDSSRWFGNQLWYADNEQQFNIIFEGTASSVGAVNTRLIDPAKFTSYWDILDPQFKGKIVVGDMRKPGPNTIHLRFIWATESLGQQYLQKLIRDMDVTITDDSRQAVDWIAQGRNPIAIFIESTEVDEAAKQGLPVSNIDSRRFKEGFPLTAGFGSVAVMNGRPHPNATIVYVNWLLSREGQLAYQKEVGRNSLRIDIPKDMVSRWAIPIEETRVFPGNLERYLDIEKAARDFVVKNLN
ncbi:MAG TPA: extracellular solute-binding protein [Chloroflexota bacterium]|nr:extracellular solute-binding protein [Chloroflexota bacterium]